MSAKTTRPQKGETLLDDRDVRQRLGVSIATVRRLRTGPRAESASTTYGTFTRPCASNVA